MCELTAFERRSAWRGMRWFLNAASGRLFEDEGGKGVVEEGKLLEV